MQKSRFLHATMLKAPAFCSDQIRESKLAVGGFADGSVLVFSDFVEGGPLECFAATAPIAIVRTTKAAGQTVVLKPDMREQGFALEYQNGRRELIEERKSDAAKELFDRMEASILAFHDWSQTLRPYQLTTKGVSPHREPLGLMGATTVTEANMVAFRERGVTIWDHHLPFSTGTGSVSIGVGF